MIMTLEEKFNVEIADEQAEKLKTVGDVISFISSKKA
jgi:acyl carrier protein